ncbi:MAG: VanZ family protein, partial [Flavobacteriaceae bacterium]
DKAVHFTFYFVAVVSGVLAIREHTKGDADLKRTLIYALIAMVVFGIIIEVLQYKFTVDRTGDIYDGLANSLGAFGGSLAAKFLFSRQGLLNWKQ